MRPPRFDPSWTEEVRAVYRHDLQEMWDPTIAPHVWNLYHDQLELYMSLVEREGPSQRVLDVGCAQGTLALLLAERGHRVWALDLRQAFLDYAATRHERGEVHFVCGNVLDLDLAERFDVIFANQIIEHLVYPERLLERLSQLLAPGGLLVVSTPNGLYVRNKLPTFAQLVDRRRYEALQFTADGDGHFFAYTGDELLELFHAAGFEARLHPFESPWISGHMKLRHLHRLVPVRWLRAADRACLGLPLLRERFAHQLVVIARLAASPPSDSLA